MSLLARCAYVLCIAAVIGPLSELFIQAWPVELTSLQWRVGFAGLFPTTLMMPGIGLLGLFWAARELEHRAGLMVFTMTSLILLLALVPVSIVYVGDFFEMRVEVMPEGFRVFDQTGVSNAINMVLMWIVYGTYTWNGLAVLRRREEALDA